MGSNRRFETSSAVRLLVAMGMAVSIPLVVGLPAASSPTPTCFGRHATIVGTAADERIEGTVGADVIVGLGGQDIIDGLGGGDRICGNGGPGIINGAWPRPDGWWRSARLHHRRRRQRLAVGSSRR